MFNNLQQFAQTFHFNHSFDKSMIFIMKKAYYIEKTIFCKCMINPVNFEH